MAKIASQLTELIGNTPLLELTNYEKELGLKAHIVAKLEYFNPLGSVKDRVAAAMIEQGIKDGLINQETVIIEPTSGNTGIGLAFVSAAKGLHLILTMPDTMSVERRKIVSALGAEIVLTPGREGMKGAIAKANELKEQYGNAFIPQQCENVSDMWLTICCWRAIIECVCWQILCLFNTLLKYLIFFPEVQYLLLSVHEFQFSRNLVVHVVFPFCDKYKKALRRNQDEGL